MHVQQEDQNPKLFPCPWDGPLSLLVWCVWLPSSRKGQSGAMGLAGLFPRISDCERLKLPQF
jgi:hypothetical protein